ncbi:DNA internalization-related competence protein ComEC/Rec2 [Mannheimia haemolytica]|uniref:DNA internalization-related competence protein ComEC/Rec2 n=1 Tax=Mannheimia haemolytica TaxID=75985 RepID=A0A3S5BBJ1_MANHA|nr:MBL fold metallo-hydrolase [Mannheimia haemolytica]VEI77118.1 DNA internalization-related competence protein ComEC/Rec2 [Mannheimia haemolytica]
MDIKLIRSFHAVGQGAFYSERFINDSNIAFNVVYDCGAMPKSKVIDRVIKESFKESDDIDILFISHFDSDHVNGIEILKKNRNIKRVVMPLLAEKEKFFLINLYKSLGGTYNHSLVKLIENPEVFFGEDTKVIQVKSININDRDLADNNDSEIKHIMDISSINGSISSGTPISFKLSDTFFWVYYPYNYKYSNRRCQFIQEITKKGITEENLADPEFVSNSKNQIIIRTAYKSKAVDGSINENSMLVCSCPMKISIVKYMDNYQGYFPLYLSSYFLWDEVNPGCIYTGDSDLKVIASDLLNKINNIKSNIGTIQVAHHGSHNNFYVNFFNQFGEFLICPISFGTKNTYGHPSYIVLSELFCHKHIPVCVTEQRGSSFFQRFDISLEQ